MEGHCHTPPSNSSPDLDTEDKTISHHNERNMSMYIGKPCQFKAGCAAELRRFVPGKQLSELTHEKMRLLYTILQPVLTYTSLLENDAAQQKGGSDIQYQQRMYQLRSLVDDNIIRPLLDANSTEGEHTCKNTRISLNDHHSLRAEGTLESRMRTAVDIIIQDWYNEGDTIDACIPHIRTAFLQSGMQIYPHASQYLLLLDKKDSCSTLEDAYFRL